MDKIRSYLPDILDATGIAFGLLFCGVAVLSLDNPLLVVSLFILGVVGFSALMSLASLVRDSRTRSDAAKRIQADVRAIAQLMQQSLRAESKHVQSSAENI